MKWTGDEIARAVAGEGRGTWVANGVSIDTRTMREGELYVALRGERVDGHKFVHEAVAKKAVGALVSAVSADMPRERQIVVGDTLIGLQKLGQAARLRAKGKVVAVTGSVGKTTAKEMLRLALGAYASYGNYNNHIGAPLNLANFPADAPYGVFELGMNHAGEIAELTRWVRPHVALITAVEAVHMEFFTGVDAIADAKAEIFEGLVKDGVAVIPRDSAQYERLRALAKHRVVTFGRHAESDVKLLRADIVKGKTECEISLHGKKLHYTLSAIGEPWALLSAAVLAVVEALSGDVAKAALALAKFEPMPGRGQIISLTAPCGEVVLIDDSYNASPASMRAGLSTLHAVAKGRKVAVLGDMLELGKDELDYHRGLAGDVQEARVQLLITAGTRMQALHEALAGRVETYHVGAAMDALEVLQKHLRAGDTLLVKGSHGSHMYQLAEALRTMWGETEQRHAV